MKTKPYSPTTKQGNIVKVTDTNGAQEIYEYDLLNRETKKINKDGRYRAQFLQ